jgi:hypothetical protein
MMERHVARTRKRMIAWKVLCGNPERKIAFGLRRRGWEYNIKTYFKDIQREFLD